MKPKRDWFGSARAFSRLDERPLKIWQTRSPGEISVRIICTSKLRDVIDRCAALEKENAELKRKLARKGKA